MLHISRELSWHHLFIGYLVVLQIRRLGVRWHRIVINETRTFSIARGEQRAAYVNSCSGARETGTAVAMHTFTWFLKHTSTVDRQ